MISGHVVVRGKERVCRVREVACGRGIKASDRSPCGGIQDEVDRGLEEDVAVRVAIRGSTHAMSKKCDLVILLPSK